EQRVDERLVAEEVGPLGVVEIGRDDRRALAITPLHQLEENIRLFGWEIEIPHLVNHENIHLDEPVEKHRRPGRDRRTRRDRAGGRGAAGRRPPATRRARSGSAAAPRVSDRHWICTISLERYRRMDCPET